MIRKFLDLPNDSTSKTLGVALILCLVCSILVSAAAVGLKPLQLANKAADKQRNILEVAGLMQEGADMDTLFANIEARVVDLETGQYTDAVDVTSYDQRKAVKDPTLSDALTADEDMAKIKRRAKFATVYLVKDGDAVKHIILPVHGYGLWSTLYGFVALENDGNTVYGLKFYEHGETPGLGGEVDNVKWRKLWQGKTVFDDNGQIAIEVVRGKADPGSTQITHQVDGLAGATLTSKGVNNLMQYWLGENGFGPYLKQIRMGNS